ncbi:MAG TPA: cellulase family glycosylhydrolase [Abditibacteriaceae bacterium]|nr:cellulase family glycosylhydrolase [Abditibacteriaceae bacterium]
MRNWIRMCLVSGLTATVLTSSSCHAAPADRAPLKIAQRNEVPQRLATRPDALHSRVRSELRVFTQWLQANKVRGFIGEVGWPDDVKGDAQSWNRLADAWLGDADKAGLWVTTWATGEWWGTSYPLAPYERRLTGEGVDSPNTQAATLEAHRGTRQILRGVNVSGGEFGSASNINPGVYDQQYHYDPQGTFTYLASRGFKLVRLPFRWERLQRNLNSELDATELGRLKGAVARARRAGLNVVLDMHNYGDYQTEKDGKGVRQTIGSPEVPNAAFADVWRRLSREFKSDAGVFYGLMNEPHDFPAQNGKSGAQVWEVAAQVALNAIRANGDKKLVMVPGYNWSGAQGWAGTHPKSWIVDPTNNFRYEAHHYWDRDNSGDYPDRYSDEVQNAEQRGFKP